MPQGTRLTINAGQTLKEEAWQQVCQRAFQLQPRDANELLASLPVTLPLAGTPQAVERVQTLLLRAGVNAVYSQGRVAEHACSRHLAVLSGEMCPKCQEATACALCLVTSKLCPGCADKKQAARKFRNIRVAILLCVLVLVALVTVRDSWRVRSWRKPVVVAVHPIIGTASAAEYVRSMKQQDFQPVEEFMAREAARHGVGLSSPVRVVLGLPMTGLPPSPPEASASIPEVMAWSLRMRWWSWNAIRTNKQPNGQVHIYVVYHSPESQETNQSALGLERGHIGVVHAPASGAAHGWTTVALTHELLHTCGASDKYDERGLPIHPHGYAEPDKIPLHPQSMAEIMAGSIPEKENRSWLVRSLEECRVGLMTAAEIGWKREGNAPR